MKITDITDITVFKANEICRIMVGYLRCTYPSIHLSFRLRWHSQDHGRLPDEDMSKHSHKNLDHDILAVTQKLALTLSRSRSVARRGHVQAFTQKSRSRSVDRAAHIQAFTQKLALTLSRSRSVARRARVQACAQKSPCVDTI